MCKEAKIPGRNWMWDTLSPHIGHDVVCICYGDPNDPDDICIECESCNCVLVSAESFDLEEDVQ